MPPAPNCHSPILSDGCLWQRCVPVRWMLRVLLCAALALPALPVGAGTESVEVAQLSPKDLPDKTVETFATLSTQFRQVGIRDAKKLNAFFAAGGTKPFDLTAVADDPDIQKDFWSLFFKHTQAYLGNGLSDTPVLGFYDPFVDYWLLTYWQEGDKGYYLAATELYAGSHMRASNRGPSPSLDQSPDWLRAAGAANDANPITLRDSLQELTALSVTSYLVHFPTAGRAATHAPDAQVNATLLKAVFRNRLSAFFKQIVDFVVNDPLREQYQTTVAAIAENDTNTLADLESDDKKLETLNLIGRIKKELRSALEPFVVLGNEKTVIILSGNTSNARWVTLTIHDISGDKVHLSALGFYDLYDRVHGQ